MLASAPEVFGNGKDREHEKIELERDRLYKKVGQLLPRPGAGVRGELKADAPDRPAAHAPSHAGQPQHAQLSMPAGPPDEPQASAAAYAAQGSGLGGAWQENHHTGAGTQDLPVSMDEGFYVSALERALRRHGSPDISNTDQGSQYTGAAYTGALKDHGVVISMNGRGRATDNIMIERRWRTVKYDDIYLKKYETVAELIAGL